MSLRFALSAVLLAAAAPAFAQQPATTPPAGGAAAAPPAQPSPAEIAAIQTAAQGFGTCIQGGVATVPATVTPEAGASTVLAACGTQRDTLVHAVEAMLANMPEPQRSQGHAQMESQLGAVQGQIAEGIRQSRAAAAAPATPAPATPAPAATPH